MASDSKRFDVYNIKESTQKGAKGFWTKVGTAFENKDSSFNVFLDCLPLDGKLHIRLHVPKEDKGETFSE